MRTGNFIDMLEHVWSGCDEIVKCPSRRIDGAVMVEIED